LNSISLPKKLELDRVSSTSIENRFPSEGERDPEERFQILDPATGQPWGYVVIDDTRRGPGLGGIRVTPDLTLGEVARLAYSMTLKNAAANLPYGGGKSGLVYDPLILKREGGLRRDLMGLFAEALFEIETYICAPDMGTDENDIQQIYEYFSEQLGTTQHMRGGASRPPSQGGIPIDEWGLTAHSLLVSIQTMESLLDDFRIAGCRVVIQGFGNVGSMIASKLHEQGAIITGASDIHGALWNSGGLDVKHLKEIRHKTGGISTYTGKIEKKFGPKQKDWVMEAPCDLLIPAARPDAITSRNSERIQCRMIFQGANAPVNKMTEYYLQNRRGIFSFSDFIVNVGGVMGCAMELKMTVDPEYRARVLDIGKEGRNYIESRIAKTLTNNIKVLWSRMRENPQKDTLFREEALRLAHERLENCSECWI